MQDNTILLMSVSCYGLDVNMLFSVQVHSTANSENFELLLEVERPRVAGLQFSPCGTILALWEPSHGTFEAHCSLIHCIPDTCNCDCKLPFQQSST